MGSQAGRYRECRWRVPYIIPKPRMKGSSGSDASLYSPDCREGSAGKDRKVKRQEQRAREREREREREGKVGSTTKMKR